MAVWRDTTPILASVTATLPPDEGLRPRQVAVTLLAFSGIYLFGIRGKTEYLL